MASPPPPRPAPRDVVPVFGADPPTVANLPPLPALQLRMTEQPSPPPLSLVANGAPPEGPRLALGWAFRALILQAHEAAIDPTISSATRRKEVRVILAAAARLYPDAARAEVANTIDEDRREIEGRRRAKAAAKLEARPPAGAAKVIPIRTHG